MHVLPHESSYTPRRNQKSLSSCAEYMPRGTKKTRAANRHARTHAQFQMWVPKGYFKSRRKIKGQFGTIFTSGNLKTAEIVSVQKLSTEKLLMDAGNEPQSPDFFQGHGSSPDAGTLRENRR